MLLIPENNKHSHSRICRTVTEFINYEPWWTINPSVNCAWCCRWIFIANVAYSWHLGRLPGCALALRICWQRQGALWWLAICASDTAAASGRTFLLQQLKNWWKYMNSFWIPIEEHIATHEFESFLPSKSSVCVFYLKCCTLYSRVVMIGLG